MKKNNAGFGLIEILIILAVVGFSAAAGAYWWTQREQAETVATEPEPEVVEPTENHEPGDEPKMEYLSYAGIKVPDVTGELRITERFDEGDILGRGVTVDDGVLRIKVAYGPTIPGGEPTDEVWTLKASVSGSDTTLALVKRTQYYQDVNCQAQCPVGDGAFQAQGFVRVASGSESVGYSFAILDRGRENRPRISIYGEVLKGLRIERY